MNVLTRWYSDGADIRKQQILDWSAARDSGLFRLTLIPRGYGRVDPWEFARELTAAHIVTAPLIAVGASEMTPELATRLRSYHVPVVAHFIRESASTAIFQRRLAQLLSSGLLSSVEPFFYASSTALSLPSKFVQQAHQLALLGPTARPSAHPQGRALGICARASDEEAVAALIANFPPNRAQQLIFALRLCGGEEWSHWAKAAALLAPAPGLTLYPMANSRTPVPYLVGSYETVARLLAQHDMHFFLIDYPLGELEHVRRSLELLGPG